MTSRKELSELTLRFQARTLNIYRKLFFDLQEREYSVELRDRAAKLAKAINLRNTPEITFVLDQSIEYGVNMSRLIDEVNRDIERNEPDSVPVWPTEDGDDETDE